MTSTLSNKAEIQKEKQTFHYFVDAFLYTIIMTMKFNRMHLSTTLPIQNLLPANDKTHAHTTVMEQLKPALRRADSAVSNGSNGSARTLLFGEISVADLTGMDPRVVTVNCRSGQTERAREATGQV